MRLVILDNYAGVSNWAAKYIKKRINDFKPTKDRYFVLGLPTGFQLYKYNHFLVNILKIYILGGTPLGTYKQLIELYKNGELSFKYVKTFNMDEYVGMILVFNLFFMTYVYNCILLV